ncbi:MAG TPA: ABC transporter ATP-binding protein [Steroidobacteraceae bacterium]|nr:ABC transporter ATP-binding protein [Steroidobacteraceae bacterium]
MSITLDQITKRYQGVPVVNDVSIDIQEGEFFVLLGSSGSGKSTLLRAIAGLTGVDHGRISLHGRDVTHVAARARGVGLVFQNYALFRHMTVADNIEFALRVRRVKALERRRRRAELLRLVALEGMDQRLPAQLSGGQQQRVAVARALAHNPEVLLLDEPFGALDAKIREELRRTIRQVQRELGITTILVTHDQDEAFALADRIGVMNLGRLLEVGRPEDLYARPATRFVATFLGAANLLLARRGTRGINFGGGPVIPRVSDGPAPGREQEVVTVLRPEEIELAADREALGCSYMDAGTVEEVLSVGALERIRVRLTGAAAAQLLSAGEERAILDVTRTRHEQRVFPVAAGQHVAIGVRRLHVLSTPLSSFTACAPDEGGARALSRQPLLVELAARMNTRVSARVEPQLGVGEPAPGGSPATCIGCAVVAARRESGRDIAWLLQGGAESVLVLPRDTPAPRRVLIHWEDEEVRRATLAASASLLRHLAAEAIYIGILPGGSTDAQRPVGMRSLLDARSEAQAVHGLDMRTELRFGEVAAELSQRLAEAPDQLLILGISGIDSLTARFALLFADPARPVLVIHQPGSGRDHHPGAQPQAAGSERHGPDRTLAGAAQTAGGPA